MKANTDYKIPIPIEGLKRYKPDTEFILESGDTLLDLTIAYHTYGRLNQEGTNVMWICHALTANSKVDEWWSGLFGKGNIFDPEKYFIVCANIIGSCYGTTGPRSINPKTSLPYGIEFPLVTIRDWVKAHALLADFLKIKNIQLAIGGSGGAHQVLEMCLHPNLKIEKAALLANSAKETTWSIAIHEAQRMALEADPRFYQNTDDAGLKALEAARAMGLITYRTNKQYKKSQSDTDTRLSNFKVQSYLRYQGKKLSHRFYAHSYYHLLNSLDTHHIGRNRNSIETALKNIKVKCLIISIDSDILIPPEQQKVLSEHIPNSEYHIISSDFGHDGFLVEIEKIKKLIIPFLLKM